MWDDTVAAHAQNYAKQRRGDCALQHSGGPYGENMFKGSGVEYTPADAVNSWAQNANAGARECSTEKLSSCLHFK